MKKENSNLGYINRRGSSLMIILMILAIVSILGISLITVATSNFKQTVVEREFQSVYYIAEAGVNYAINDIGKKVDELSEDELSHIVFFNALNNYLDTKIDSSTLNDFEEAFGDNPLAEITIESDGTETVDGGYYTEVINKYIITSIGNIGNRNRTVSTSIEIAHRIDKEIVSGHHPAFDYALYSGGNSNLELPSGSVIDGSVYGYNIIFNASATKFTGNIISETSVQLSDSMDVKGNIYAMNGTAKILSSSTKVSGDIHATGDVTLSSGTTLNGSIYTNGETILNSSNATVTGDIHAGRNIKLESSSKAKNIFTNGKVNFFSWGATINGDIHAMSSVGGTDNGGGVTVHGDVFSGSNVITKANQTYNLMGNVYAAGNVENGSGNNILGNVISGKKIINGGTIKGSTIQNGNPIQPLHPIYPQAPNFREYESIENPELNNKLLEYKPSTDTVTISTNTLRLIPGNHGIIKFDTNQGGTIILESGSGDYFFNSITGENQNKTMRLDFSKGGNINIYVKNNLKWNGKIEISTNGNNWINLKDLSKEEQEKFAERVYWETHGSFEIHEGGDKHWLGTILSKGKISVASKPYIVGALVTHNQISSNNSGGEIIYASGNIGNGSSGGSGGTSDEGQNSLPSKDRMKVNPIREK